MIFFQILVFAAVKAFRGFMTSIMDFTAFHYSAFDKLASHMTGPVPHSGLGITYDIIEESTFSLFNNG